MIDKIIGMKRFPLKEIVELLGSTYTISNRKKKADLIRMIEEIFKRSEKNAKSGESLLMLFRNTADPEIRDSALRILEQTAILSHIPSIILLFRHPKQLFRQGARKLLDNYPSEQVGRTLSAELLKGNWANRSEPLEYLYKIHPEGVMQPCRKALEIGDEEDKIQALKILSELQTPEAIRSMEYVIEDESVRIRRQVAKAFGRLNGPVALRNLVKLANDPKPDVILTALDGLRSMKSPAGISAALKCLKHENISIRKQAILTLGEIGTADEVEYLTSALKDKDIRIRQGALEALISLSQNAETDIPKFVTILMSDPDVNVRRAAAQILGQVDAPGLFDKLFDYLRDEDWWVRETIAETLSKIKDDRIFPAAVNLLSNQDASLRRYAIEILMGLENKKALVPLIKMLKDPDWWVRERAVSALGVLGDGKIVPIVSNLLSIKELAYVAAEALGNIRDKSAVPPLLKALESPEIEIRLAVMSSLEKLQAKEAIPQIEKLVSDPDREVRSHAKEVLMRLKVDVKKLDSIANRWWEQHEFSLLDNLLLEVRYRKASDLFLISNHPPMAKIRGDMTQLTNEQLTEEHILTMASQILTPDQETVFFNTNDLDFSYEIAGEGRFRGNMFRHADGVNLVFRLLPDDIPVLENLGMPALVHSLVKLSHGLILVTGPASCGKSTTLAAMIREINDNRSDHVITIEDPIEYVHPRVNCLITQREVGRHTSSFAKALRAALREDPDVILVGELRDLETISMALTAAETGHLVLATLHSISATKTIDRIIDVFPTGKQGQIRTMLAESLKAILSQQLLTRKDSSGHALALEILVNTSAIASLIRENKLHQIPSLITAGQQHGMITMDQSLLDLLRKDLITPEDAYLRAEDKSNFESYIKDVQVTLNGSN
ncbi:PilT/PilU family type 4a pilus ATPase [bacterium]|nr:PilT/PilU family type 4a pilus ATPase [candidate division CSSED10-310 bacterium]